MTDWHLVLDVNLTGQFLCAREAVREFKRRGIVKEISAAAGKIISILHSGETLTFFLRQVDPTGDTPAVDLAFDHHHAFQQTVQFWRRWVSVVRYKGRLWIRQARPDQRTGAFR